MHELVGFSNFVFGREKQRAGDLEGAIEAFTALLLEIVEKHGDDSAEAAPAWYVYGDALLQKEEENPSYGLLGSATEKEVEAKAEKEAGSSAAGEGEEEDEKEGAAAPAPASSSANDNEEEEEEAALADADADTDAEADFEGGGEDDYDDLQVAFEALETARRLYEANANSAESDVRLAEIRMRLGDLKRFNNDEVGAIEEYV